MFDKGPKFHVGDKPGAGTYKCTLCGKEEIIKDDEELKACKRCHHKTFVRVDTLKD